MILVSGGTGLLGRQVVRRLTDRSLGVRVLTRDPDSAADLASGGVDIVQGDLRDRTSVAAAVDGATTVVAAAHGFVGPRGISPATVDRDGNIRLIEAARAVGAHVVLLSVVGASPDSPMELFRMKYAAEQHLFAGDASSTIVRATAFTELWIRIMRETAARGGRPLVFGRGQSLVNFVSVADVAALVDHVVDDPHARGQVWEIGGPDNLTMNELARLVQETDGRAGAPRHVPRFMLHAMAHTVGLVVPQLGRQARASLAMDAADHPFDSAPLRRRLPNLAVTSVADVLGQPSAATRTSNPADRGPGAGRERSQPAGRPAVELRRLRQQRGPARTRTRDRLSSAATGPGGAGCGMVGLVIGTHCGRGDDELSGPRYARRGVRCRCPASGSPVTPLS